MMKKPEPALSPNRLQSSGARFYDGIASRTFYLSVLVACIFGLLLFAKFESDRDKAIAHQQTAVWADTIKSRVSALLLQGDVLAQQAGSVLSSAPGGDLPASEQRRVARQIGSLIEDSPASGLILLGRQGSVLRAFGVLPETGFKWPKSEVLPDQDMDLILCETGNGKFIGYMNHIHFDGDTRIVVVYPYDVFLSRMNDAVMPTLLFSRDGDLLAVSKGLQAYAENSEVNVLTWLQQDFTKSDRTGIQELDKTFREKGVSAATSIVGDGKAQVMAFRMRNGILGTLWAYRDRLGLLLGPVLLVFFLAWSLVQNERRRHDKSRDNSENMAARAQIASNILSAGIINWSIDEGRVDYSDGWAALLGYEKTPQHEEIFDWIERIHPEDRVLARNAYADLQQGNAEVLSHEIRVRTTGREYVCLLEKARMHRDTRGYRHVVLVQLSVS